MVKNNDFENGSFLLTTTALQNWMKLRKVDSVPMLKQNTGISIPKIQQLKFLWLNFKISLTLPVLRNFWSQSNNKSDKWNSSWPGYGWSRRGWIGQWVTWCL